MIKTLAFFSLFVFQSLFGQAATGPKKEKLKVAFLGVQSRADNHFHESLEKNIRRILSYNANLKLAGKSFSKWKKTSGLGDEKLFTLDETVVMYKATGMRAYMGVEIRTYGIRFERLLGVLPFGKAVGEITCYLQVIDGARQEIRFADEVKFVGEVSLGYIGYGKAATIKPLSPIQKFLLQRPSVLQLPRPSEFRLS